MNSKIKYIFAIFFGSAVLGAIIIRLCINETTFVDDSYIFLKIARNVISGHGFVWNIGELPLEGYTSFLYLVINIIALKFFSQPELFLQIFGIITSGIIIVLVYRLYDSVNPTLKTENLVTAILVSISPCFLYWSLAGMETSFYMMFLSLTVLVYTKRNNTPIDYFVIGVLFGILSLIRPESIVFFVYAILFSIYQFYREKVNNKMLLLVCIVLGFQLIFTPYFLWRLNYFGEILPNSYYAKVGGGFFQVKGGLYYLFVHGKKLFTKGWYVLIPILAISVFGRKNEKQIFILGIAILSVTITVINGGDLFDYARFLLPVLPFILILVPSIFNKIYTFFNIKIEYTLFCFLLPLIVLLLNLKNPMYSEFIFKPRSPLVVDKNKITYGYNWEVGFIKMGKALKNISNPEETIAVMPVGTIGYFSGMKVLDMAGILNPHIAKEPFDEKYSRHWRPGHNKGDGYYILSQKPEYIQLVDYLTTSPQSIPGPHGLFFKSVYEIWNSPVFHSEYEFYPIQISAGIYYNLYKRK